MATTYETPGVYVEEKPGGPRPIQAVGTSTAGFVGIAPNEKAFLNEAVSIEILQSRFPCMCLIAVQLCHYQLQGINLDQ